MKPFILLILCLGLANAQLAKKKGAKYGKLDIVPVPFDDEACGDTTRPKVLTDSEGQFVSPNYPGQYPNSANCWWLIATDLPDHVVVLDFDFLRTEADYDGIFINDGNLTSSPMLTGFDGNYNPAPTGITSTGPSMLFRFVTDTTVTDVGFSASYRIVPFDSTPDACSSALRPHVLNDESGMFSTRGYPNSYWNYADCQWHVQNPVAGGRVTVSFGFFKTEANYDFVYVFDGDSTSGNILAVLSGNLGSAGPYMSTGDSLFILFTSDQTIEDTGFNANYARA